MKTYGIILASGTGSRFGAEIPKQFVKIAGRTVFEHTIDVFESSKYIDSIIVVITPEYRNFAEEILKNNSYKKVIKLLNGGAVRTESSSIGVNAVEEDEANVLIHDCARPLVTDKIIENCVKALEKYKSVAVAIPSADTIIKVKENIIEEIPPRKDLMRIQTPQCFKLSVIKQAHLLAQKDKNTVYTDDCGLILHYNLCKVFVVEGDINNIKITYPEDIYTAEKILEQRTL